MTLLNDLVSRRWRWGTVLVLAVCFLFVRLGFWQLDRLQQRRVSNAELLAALETPPIQFNNDFIPPHDLATLQNRDVLVEGVYDFEQQIILILQNWGGRPGVHLITPLLLDDGETAVLVDRGWIPDAELPEQTKYDETGFVAVAGYIGLSQTLSRQPPPPDTPQTEWFRVDVAAIQAQMPYQLLPFYVIQTPLVEGNVALPFHPSPDIDLSEGPHLGYAIQWFTFTLITMGGYLAFVNKSRVADEQKHL